ncbi:hypothetical protein PGTUg99_025366 [Puccinia graminis f. sp. tritici]|uniref:Uncharacterized protein n=1 Tax=Puccinia graminis f. sp. tritici TaxID=56615 RepID=A0A5B0SDZ0_PUCGR|nr:hypothetical protein PGTUg99_025366 [Puccinia graminis f. sp. tritici]
MPYQPSSNHLRRIPEDSSARLSLIVCGRDAGVFCATVEEKGDRATTDSPDQACERVIFRSCREMARFSTLLVVQKSLQAAGIAAFDNITSQVDLS